MGNGYMPVPAAAAGFRARDVRDADAWHAANRRTNRCDAVFHRVGRSDQARDVSTAAADSRGEAVMAVGRLGGWAVGLITLLTAQPLNRLTAQTDRSPLTIDTIIIENSNVFDHEGRAPDWVAHLANRLHVRTRQWVIRRRMLLNRGDVFDRARMEESERSLRALGVFRSVRVDTGLSHGHHGEWHFGLPFHETVAPHSIETYGELADQRVLRFRDDVLLDSTRRHLLRVGLLGGIAVSASSHHYTRLWGGWEWRREDFTLSDTAHVPYSVFTTVRGGIEIGSVRFRVLEQFNSYARREDVDLSPTLRVGVALQSGVGYEVMGQTSAVWKRGFALVRVAADGLDTTRTQAQLTVVSQDIRRHTLIAHAEGGIVTHPKPGAEFDPWVEPRGPRLFGIHAFTGTRTTWFVLEDRILVANDILGLMALGLAPFLDYGGAWYSDEPARQGGDAGVSLRFGPTRAVRGEAAELAFGYRFGQGMKGKRWAFTLRKGFSF